MAGGETGFELRDLRAARAFGRAAREAGIAHIIYLGGLGDPSSELSAHLSSRQEVGAELAAHGVPVTEFRAAVIIGSGSASFELRSLAPPSRDLSPALGPDACQPSPSGRPRYLGAAATGRRPIVESAARRARTRR
jgi:uncharacterized protein YbjT (DUF2867 family)